MREGIREEDTGSFRKRDERKSGMRMWGPKSRSSWAGRLARPMRARQQALMLQLLQKLLHATCGMPVAGRGGSLSQACCTACCQSLQHGGLPALARLLPHNCTPVARQLQGVV